MTVLITEAGSALGHALARQLGDDVRLTDRPDAPVKADSSISSSFQPDQSTDALVEGIDTLVHLTSGIAHSCTDVTDTTWLDGCVRDTYNLLRAASQAGVRKVVLVTTLDVFLPYPADIACLQEGGNTWPGWKPLPSCEPEILGPHMTEFVAREFAHAGALRIANVRLGTLDAPEARFFTSTAEAVEAIARVVSEGPMDDPIELDWNDEGQRGYEQLNYRVYHVGTENPAAGSPGGSVGSRIDTGGSVERTEQTLLLTGGNGMLGPPVISEMMHDFTLHVSDVAPLGWREQPGPEWGGTKESAAALENGMPHPHKSLIVDAADSTAVRASVAGVDCVVNLAVVRPDRQAAFDVNCRGTYNAIRAAVDQGHARFINTGPHL